MIKQILSFIALSFFLTGCAGTYLLSPSEHLYYEGNDSYNQKNYTQAIEFYNKMLEKSPNSKMATSAKINLGMAYFYIGNHEKAKEILSSLQIDNDKLKEYINNICKQCNLKITEKNGGIAPVTPTPAQSQETITITVTDASLTDNGDLVLVGQANTPIAQVTINNKTATIQDQSFKAQLYWRRGQEVLITAKDDQGNFGKLSYYPDREAPPKPQGLNIVNTSSSSAEIEWDQNSDNDIFGYKLYYRLIGGSINEVRDIIQDTRYEVVGLNNLVQGVNKTFEFYLKAVDKMRNVSDDSNKIEVTLP